MTTETKNQNWFIKHWIISIFLGLILIVFINWVGDELAEFIGNNSEITEKVINEQTQQATELIQEEKTCMPDWTCGSWSECSKSGTQTRLCADINECGLNSGKPSEIQTCTYQYSLGDKVIVEEVAYTIHSKTENNQIGEYNEYIGFMGETADGIFYIFDITLENVGKESTTFWGSNIKIYDTQGRTFDHDTTAEIYLDDSFSYDQLQPGLPKRGKIVFDVPKKLKGKLEISSTELFSDKKEYISWE